MSHGFELLADQHVPELNTRARLYRHLKTGAELLSLENDDENKSFGITFRTPPEDSTGLPHILEHSVLCGSQKYPVKEPFVQLLKSSVNTFLNAITFSDKTSYPFASTNLQDFYNLLDVYIDAVFYPRITPETLMQQGWHYELEDSSNPLIYKGVVFNEMKGALSSPEPHLARAASRGLFPDTIYANFSGGDPVVMPDLTYEQFKNFYDTFYHPSNALIYFYGDDDPEERLRRMDGYLSAFERKEVNAAVALQSRFDEPRRIRHSYPSGEDTAKKSFLTVNWMLDETVDLDMKMAFTVLNHILLGTPASPLRKALLDSRLGEDVAGGGYSSQIRQTTFGVGLKNIDLADADKVESLVLETLRDLAQNGIDPLQVETTPGSSHVGWRCCSGCSPPGSMAATRSMRWRLKRLCKRSGNR
jgi:presequence protease